MILLAESRLSNEFILKFDVAKGCVLFLFSLLYKDSHIHTFWSTKAHVCIYNGVNIFCIWYCSTCSSIVRVLNCANVIIKIGMISYGKSRFFGFQIIVIIIPPITVLNITYHCVVWNELWFIQYLRLCLLQKDKSIQQLFEKAEQSCNTSIQVSILNKSWITTNDIATYR